MQHNELQPGRVRKTVNDLVMAEMFLLQATIESATVIGDGINEIGKQINTAEEKGQRSWSAISTVLQQTADEALEAYTSRYRYFRHMISSDK
jgi:hypothetical protein